MNEAQKSTMYREVQEKPQSESDCPDTSALAQGSGLDLPGMVAGLNEVGASGELAYCAGFLTVDSATALHEGRELKSQSEFLMRCPPWLTG